jgi:transposase-like protein
MLSSHRDIAAAKKFFKQVMITSTLKPKIVTIDKHYISRNRGCIDFMIAADLNDGWYEDHSGNRKRRGQKRYSAILMCLQLRCLFGLKLRQSQDTLLSIK